MEVPTLSNFRQGGDGSGRDRKNFSALIYKLCLIDLSISGGAFTQSDMNEDPYFGKLDRILVSLDGILYRQLTLIIDPLRAMFL